tara:strand:- start:1288 stop:1650 length:363 start_codon:yes stop_codon:yes gene_type:complete
VIHPPARIDKKIKQKVLIMIHYLVIGVRRDPGQDPMDYDSFAPARLNFSSEKQLTTEELKEAFKANIEESWAICNEELEEGESYIPEEGYQNVDYIFRSASPFPDFEVFGTDLVNDYLGS